MLKKSCGHGAGRTAVSNDSKSYSNNQYTWNFLAEFGSKQKFKNLIFFQKNQKLLASETVGAKTIEIWDFFEHFEYFKI